MTLKPTPISGRTAYSPAGSPATWSGPGIHLNPPKTKNILPNPEGYSIIANTWDTNPKAFKKKQLCYRLTPFKGQADSIVDIDFSLDKIKYPGVIRLGTGSPQGQDNGRRSSTSNGFASPPYPQSNHSQSASASPAHQPRNNGYPLQGQGSELDHSAQYKMVSSVGALALTKLCGLDGVRFQLREDLRHARGLKAGILVGVDGGRVRLVLNLSMNWITSTLKT